MRFCLSTLKLWFYFSTSRHSSSLPDANFQKCILLKKKDAYGKYLSYATPRGYVDSRPPTEDVTKVYSSTENYNLRKTKKWLKPCRRYANTTIQVIANFHSRKMDVKSFIQLGMASIKNPNSLYY